MRGTKLICLLVACCLGSWSVVAGARPTTRVAAPNQPPYWDDSISSTEVTRTGDSIVLEFRAEDPEREALTYRVEKMPKGAEVAWTRNSMTRRDGAEMLVFTPRFMWTPLESDAGTHEVVVTASDGPNTIRKTVRVTVEEEWETFLMPGVAYTAYQPVASEMGLLHGPSAEILLAGWVHRNENRGPSHVRIYTSVGLLTSTESGVSKAVVPSLGFDLSVERNPRRSFFIPYFGLETGLVAQSDLGAPAYVQPFLGAHLWSDRNLFINASGGYLFPMRHVDEARGYFGKLSVDFSLW